jgi:hypothetical protein
MCGPKPASLNSVVPKRVAGTKSILDVSIFSFAVKLGEFIRIGSIRNFPSLRDRALRIERELTRSPLGTNTAGRGVSHCGKTRNEIVERSGQKRYHAVWGAPPWSERWGPREVRSTA